MLCKVIYVTRGVVRSVECRTLIELRGVLGIGGVIAAGRR